MQEFIELDGEKAFAHQIDRGKSASDLTCIIYLRDGKYDIRLSSSDALNSSEDLQRMAKAIKATAENMMADPEALMMNLSMLDDSEWSPSALLPRLRCPIICSTNLLRIMPSSILTVRLSLPRTAP